MALQTSGQIKISEIKTELGSSSNSLSTLSVAAGKTAPHAMSEFYGYSSQVANDYYWLGDGVNDTLRHTGSNVGYATSEDLTWCGWYRIDETTNQTQQLGSFSTSTPSGSNQIFIQYHGSLNRLMWRYRHANSFHQRQFPLHDNSGVTGITSSSTGWRSTNRGNANADGFVHLAFTYDASQRTVTSGMKVYWNGEELTSAAVNHSISSPSHWTAASMAVADLVSSSPNNANVFKGGIDQVCIYKDVLTQGEIQTLYNSGTIVSPQDVSLTANLIGEYRFENNANNSATGLPNLTNTGGTFVNPSE